MLNIINRKCQGRVSAPQGSVTKKRKDTENRDEMKFSRSCSESDSPGRLWGCGNFGAIFQEGTIIQADEIKGGGCLSVCHTSILSSQCLPLVKSFICFPLFLAQVPPFAFLLFIVALCPLLYPSPLAPGAGKQKREGFGFSSS